MPLLFLFDHFKKPDSFLIRFSEKDYQILKQPLTECAIL